MNHTMAEGREWPVKIEIEQALEVLLKDVRPKREKCVVPLMQALGSCVAQDIYAPLDNPPFDRSPLDGYAVCAEDVADASFECPINLPVVGSAFAGVPYESKFERGQAVRIMTGAVMPQGSDCVIRQEDTDYGEENVQIYIGVPRHQNYCFQGEDVARGTLMIRKGERLCAAHIGMLVGMGITQVEIIEPLRVALVCTGDELCEPGLPLGPGKIYNSNRWLLQARLHELGIEAVTCVTCGDSTHQIADVIREVGHGADVILTTGGVSVGSRDMLHQVVDLLGAKRLFWRIKAKPGSPLLCSEYDGKPLICLSGNPFAAFATFELFARPVFAKLMGDNTYLSQKREAVFQGSFNKTSNTRRFVRACYREGKVWLSSNNHSSGSLASLVECNCMLDIPGGHAPLQGGEKLNVLLL